MPAGAPGSKSKRLCFQQVSRPELITGSTTFKPPHSLLGTDMSLLLYQLACVACCPGLHRVTFLRHKRKQSQIPATIENKENKNKTNKQIHHEAATYAPGRIRQYFIFFLPGIRNRKPRAQSLYLPTDFLNRMDKIISDPNFLSNMSCSTFKLYLQQRRKALEMSSHRQIAGYHNLLAL